MTEAPRSLFARIRASLVFRVVIVYAGASGIVLEIVSTFGSEFGLPTWFFPSAVGLLLIGLPILLATAVVQGGVRQTGQHVPLPDFEIAGQEEAAPAPRSAAKQPLARWLTWRKSILGGVLAFTALGIVGTVIVLRGSARVTEAYGAAGDAFGERAWLVVADFDAPEGEEDVADAIREALTVDLQQSQYVNVVTRAQMAGVLRRMERPDTARVDGDLAREIAQREGHAAVLAGSISRLGDDYVLAARVLRPANGEELVAVRATAARDRLVEAVEDLSRETRLRLGESRAAIRKSQPLPEVTTRSLEALQRYTQAVDALARGDQEQALDLAEAAIDFDPAFAMAYRLAGVVHSNAGRFSESQRYSTQAYELRQKLSERERLHIEARYAATVLSDPLQAMAKYELILSAYPDDGRAANNLAVSAGNVGDRELQHRSGLRAVELDPYQSNGYANAIWSAWGLTRWAVAESLMHLAARRGLTERATRWLRMQALVTADWDRADAICDSLLAVTSPRSDFRAGDEYNCGAVDLTRGRVQRAVERLRNAAQLRLERDQHLGYYAATHYLVQAELLRGRSAAARDRLDQAVARDPLDSIPRTDRLIATFWAGVAAAQLGDVAAAQRYYTAYVADTTSAYWEPAWGLRLRATLALAEGAYEQALEHDRRGMERDFGQAFVYDQLYRAQAFDGLGQRDSAIALYEDVIAPQSVDAGPGAHILYLAYLPVAHRRLGELYAEVGEPTKAAEHYETFLELWSDCDPELRPQVESARRALERLGTERGPAPQASNG